MSEENKAMVSRAFELVNSGKLDDWDEVYAQDVKYHGAAGVEIQGLSYLKEYINQFLVAFPDLQATLELIIAEGDLVTARVVGNGTHRGEFAGIPATGKQITIAGNPTFRIVYVKIQEVWDC